MKPPKKQRPLPPPEVEEAEEAEIRYQELGKRIWGQDWRGIVPPGDGL